MCSLPLALVPHLWYREGTFHLGVLASAFRNKNEGQSSLLAPAVSQVPLTPNSMLERLILRMTYSELFTSLSEYNMQCLSFFFSLSLIILGSLKGFKSNR